VEQRLREKYGDPAQGRHWRREGAIMSLLPGRERSWVAIHFIDRLEAYARRAEQRAKQREQARQESLDQAF
jgi:hypothetical protein